MDKSTKIAIISVVSVVIIIVLAYILFPPKLDNSVETLNYNQEKYTAKMIEEKKRLTIEPGTKLGYYNSEVFTVFNGNIKKIDFSNARFTEDPSYQLVLARDREDVIFIKNREAFRFQNNPIKIISDIEDYKVEKNSIIFKTSDGYSIYNILDNKLSEVNKYSNQENKISIDNIKTFNKGKNYILEDIKRNVIDIYDTYLIQNIGTKKGYLADVDQNNPLILISEFDSNTKEIIEYNIETKESKSLKFREPSSNGLPKYFKDNFIVNISNQQVLNLSLFDRTKEEVNELKISNELVGIRELKIFDDVFAIICNDRFYLGTSEEVREYAGDFSDIMVEDGRIYLIGSNHLRLLYKGKSYDYQLAGEVSNYLINDGKFYYIYQDPSSKAYFVTYTELDA